MISTSLFLHLKPCHQQALLLHMRLFIHAPTPGMIFSSLYIEDGAAGSLPRREQNKLKAIAHGEGAKKSSPGQAQSAYHAAFPKAKLVLPH